MPQQFRLEVSLTVIRDNPASLIHGHGIHREVTPLEIFFKGDRGGSVHHTTVIAVPGFSLGASQRGFFFGFRM
jgi:hypothetical protein